MEVKLSEQRAMSDNPKFTPGPWTDDGRVGRMEVRSEDTKFPEIDLADIRASQTSLREARA